MEFNRIINKDFVLKNAVFGMQRKTDADFIKKDTEFEDIECFVIVPFIEDGITGCCKLMRNSLELIGLSEDELFEAAQKNTIEKSELISMSDALGFPVPGNMTVLTNKLRYRGAGSIFNKAKIKEYADSCSVDKVVAIPSSIDEWILIPYTSDEDVNALKGVIHFVNANEVKDEEQLGDRAYILEA